MSQRAKLEESWSWSEVEGADIGSIKVGKHQNSVVGKNRLLLVASGATAWLLLRTLGCSWSSNSSDSRDGRPVWQTAKDTVGLERRCWFWWVFLMVALGGLFFVFKEKQRSPSRVLKLRGETAYNRQITDKRQTLISAKINLLRVDSDSAPLCNLPACSRRLLICQCFYVRLSEA